MRRLPLLLITTAAFAVCVIEGSATGAAPSPYEVVWDSPSEDADGTMPLGNGEVALNAWIEPSGDLRFYIARTDSWDDNGRLVKVGSVRVRLGLVAQPPSAGDTSPALSKPAGQTAAGGRSSAQPRAAVPQTKDFRQTLTVRDGTLTARYGEGDGQVELRLWVDANRPIVCVEVRTSKPTAATAFAELWRTKQDVLPSVETSDVFAGWPEKTVVEPDTVLAGLADRIGWYHRNVKSVGPELCAKIQGVADFVRLDPLLHRTFGALIATDRPERIDDRTLRSKRGTSHVFEIYVHTKHPASAAEWLAETQRGLDEARSQPLAGRRAAHEKWWADFWGRSWIHITGNGQPGKSVGENGFPPANKHPLRIGMDQHGGSRFTGAFGRVGIYEAVLSDEEIRRLAAKGPEEKAGPQPSLVYCAVPDGPTVLKELAGRSFSKGLSVEAWIKPDALRENQGMRIVDKITPGGADGFLFDTHPGASLRVIAGQGTLHKKGVLSPGKWQHVAMTVSPRGRVKVFYNGSALSAAGNDATSLIADGDDAFVVSRAYALQRYVSACAGRGRYPIKFNGSLFTVPAEGKPGDADYRRWGPGYWWQNTRLPYYSMCASGDFDLMEPLVRMYARELMPLFTFRTRRYLGHDGAYIPECIYFWGDMFTETYGWQPADERKDKLQASGWHKWEWVSGLELVGLLLDYYEHTGDAKFLRDTALPAAREVLTFFDQQYKTGPNGKLVMHPAQALETWWDCTNPMPEVAGLHASTARLLALPEAATTAGERAFWRQLQAKLPELPTLRTDDGKVMLAAAQSFQNKRNIENPELYAVFPFRLLAFDKPHVEWAIEALNHRKDKGALGWRQDDVFMAYLGLAEQAREYLVKRARSKHAASRFPVFWGPNYDWVPDQDHGSVLLKTVQAMLMQTDGREIHLLPAWPEDWDADFRLHAPWNTVVSGKVEKGKLVQLHVEPESRRKDVRVPHGRERRERKGKGDITVAEWRTDNQ